jgi:hypothetical protein
MDRRFVASNARLSLQTMQQIKRQYKTAVIDELIASFKRIEENTAWTATQALQDHFNAMTKVAESPSDLRLLQSERSLFRNCESMMKFLIEVEGASFKVTH